MREVVSKLILLSMVLVFPAVSMAQAPSLAATMEMYVFPTTGQDSSQQSKDESECYNWAVSNVGTDPFELEKQEQANQQQAQAAAQAEQQAAATQQQLNNFKNAFSVCLEAKEYMVKY